jgi:hypothetical protein
MRKLWLAVIPLAFIVGCGSSSGSGTAATPVDLGTNVPSDSPFPTVTDTADPGQIPPDDPVTEAPPVESAYDVALDQLATHCTQSRDQIAVMVPKVLKDLQDNGINDETLMSVAQHLTTSASGLTGKIDCVSIAAGYAVIRESPSS